MRQSVGGAADGARFAARDNLAWHPATRVMTGGTDAAGQAADETTIAASLRLVARLEEETHTLTTQLAYLQALMQQVKDTLTVLQHQNGIASGRDQRARQLSQRIASAQADGYSLPLTTRR